MKICYEYRNGDYIGLSYDQITSTNKPMIGKYIQPLHWTNNYPKIYEVVDDKFYIESTTQRTFALVIIGVDERMVTCMVELKEVALDE